MRYVWLAAAFVGTLAVGVLVGLLIGAVGGGGGEQGSAASPRTVTVLSTVTARQSNPAAPTRRVGSMEEARAAFQRSVEGYGNPDLELSEVMEFANNYNAEVEEKDTGLGAMELLIGRPGNRVYQEPGPNMMWNTKYGMMGGSGGYGGMGPGGRGMMGPNGRGMMGASSASVPEQNPRGNTADKMAVSPEQARKIADAYLSSVSPGTRAVEPTKFYGYYTIDTEKEGKISGMLSVNGYSGEVWYHAWHGPFVAKEEGE